MIANPTQQVLKLDGTWFGKINRIKYFCKCAFLLECMFEQDARSVY